MQKKYIQHTGNDAFFFTRTNDSLICTTESYLQQIAIIITKIHLKIEYKCRRSGAQRRAALYIIKWRRAAANTGGATTDLMPFLSSKIINNKTAKTKIHLR